jgi:hypothetical protein
VALVGAFRTAAYETKPLLKGEPWLVLFVQFIYIVVTLCGPGVFILGANPGAENLTKLWLSPKQPPTYTKALTWLELLSHRS